MNKQQDLILVGKPNFGKSSLFNLLTGLNQKIGNYSGVTVEKKSGRYLDHQVIDLPGLKSLTSASPEEKIAKHAILNFAKNNSNILFIANGMQIEDSLILFSEIADLQTPMIFLINFKDDLEKNKINLDQNKLAEQLGCPVVMMNSRSGEGLAELKKKIEEEGFSIPNAVCRSFYDRFENDEVINKYEAYVANVEHATPDTKANDYLKRQKVVSGIVKSIIDKTENQAYLSKSKKWDRILLHPIYGLIIFLSVLFGVFQAVFTLSGYPMDWIDLAMTKLSSFSKNALPEGWINELVSDAILQGIGGVVIFIPQIAILFFLLGILEHSGYMSRISFISDAFLKKFGLSGKSVIPLMSSWACSIPAIMSTRVIDDPRERLAVIMASPLMTCSARLPVYTIIIAVIIPVDSSGTIGLQGLALLGLYVLGVVATLLVSWFIGSRSNVEANPYWSLELPIYRFPNWRNILINVYLKTKSFVLEAGKVILAISVVLWFLSTNSPKSENFVDQKFEEYQSNELNQYNIARESFDLEYSYLGYLGKVIEPCIAPLGYDWKIGIALLSSFAAREVFVGTLSTIYSIGSDEEQTIVKRLQNERNPDNGAIRFNLATSFSLLIFYVFAMQCMSTFAIVRKETGQWKYPIFQFIFMLILAYVFSYLTFYLLS